MTALETRDGEHTEPAAPARTASGVRMTTLHTFAFVVAGLAIGLRRLHDNSFMWHLRTGQLMLTHGIPHSDPYSFTAPGVKWVAQSWLAELSYGIVDKLGGGFGLRLYTGVVSAVIGGLLFTLALRCSGNRVRAFGLSMLAMAVMVQVWSERPLLLGLLAMLVIVFICEVPDAAISRRPEITIPIVMWLWLNVHGTFALGFAYLLFHLVGRALEGARLNEGRERQVLFGSIAAAAISVINPYGIDLLLFPLRLLGRSNILANVQEWQSPNFRDLGGKLFAAWIVVTIVLLARKGCGKRDLLLTVVFLVMGLWAVRNVGITVVVLLPILARATARSRAGADEPVAPRPDEPNPLNRLVLAALALAMVAFVVHARLEPNWDLRAYPVTSLQYLQDQKLIGRRLATTDAWGGFVIATQYPKQKVFFDDRYDTYPESVDRSYDSLLRVQKDWREQLDRWGIDVIMWPKAAPLDQVLALDSDWVKVHSDKVAVVYLRRPNTP